MRVLKIYTRMMLAGMALGLGVMSGCRSAEPERWDGTPAAALKVCRKELKARGYQIDVINPREGILITKPLTSKQWFEFWRNDITDPKMVAESSLHTMRRTVQCRITGDRNAPISCQVAVEREMNTISPRERTQTNSISYSGSRQLYYKKDRTVQWVAVEGGDPTLEEKLAKTINQRLAGNKGPQHE